MRYFFWIALFLFGCQPAAPKPEAVGFYYWQTTWRWSPVLERYRQGLEAKELYIRFFDVDWNEHERQAVPVSALRGDSLNALPTETAVIPTVFITNRTMYNLPDADVEALAGKIWRKIEGIRGVLFARNTLEMIQLDCDWSGETREKYFALCKAVKKASKKRLSATIRLHQVKYPQKTGIPPIDKGVLMCYNVGKIDGSDTQNSILDMGIVENYAPALASYPLPLDIALPAFGWGVLKRGGRVVKLLNQLQESDLQTPEFQSLNKNNWRVAKAHYRAGVYLYADDEIRLEKTSPALLQKLRLALAAHYKKPYRLLFFHLHEGLGQYFPLEKLRELAK